MALAVDTAEYPEKKEYDPDWERFDPHRDFIVPSWYQLTRLLEKESYRSVSIEWVNDPSQPIDNRLLVRLRVLILAKGKISLELFNRLVEPYDNGFYKKSDGKSTPLWWMKVPVLQRWAGAKKDIVAVRHDYDYYRTSPWRKQADRLYLRLQILLGQRPAIAKMEYYALRLLGWNARSKHVWKTLYTDGYGTDAHISSLPDHQEDRTIR